MFIFWKKILVKNINIFFLISLLFFSLFITKNTVEAATGINQQINFQGKIVNSDGTNVADGAYDFEFKIYSVDTAGTAIWTETRTLGNQVTVTDGIFRVALGSVTALPGSIDFNTDNIYLGINFNSDGEMSPRVQFTAVPYAFNALKVAGLTVTNTTGTLTVPDATTITYSGANDTTFTTTGTTNITLPTTGTLSSLAGTETLTNKTIGSTGLTFSGAATDITTATNEDFVISPNGTGNVGIGSATPGYKLDVTGSINASTSIISSIFDTATAGALAIGNTTATSVSICNSASCDTLSIGNNVDADTITIGDTLDGLTIASSGFNLSSSGEISGVSTFSSTGDWTWAATTPTITINSSEVFTVSDGTDSFVVDTSGSSFSFSDGTNGYTFDVDSGPSYSGNARPTRRIVLSPEYSGGTLSSFYGAGTDTSITGAMTADVETTSGDDLRTYYQWSSSQGSLNYYTVVARVKLPPDFSAWATSNALQIDFTSQSTSTANNLVSAYVYLSSDSTTAVATSLTNAASVAETWEQITIDDSVLKDASAPEWKAAGETALIYIRMGSTGSNFARIGDITLNYVSSY